MPTHGGTRVSYRCSFCSKSQDQVRRLIAGPGGVYICDECVDLCREIIEEEQSSAKQQDDDLPTVPTTSLEESIRAFGVRGFFTGLPIVAGPTLSDLPLRKVQIEFIGRPAEAAISEFFLLGQDSAGIVVRPADGGQDATTRFFPWSSIFCLIS